MQRIDDVDGQVFVKQKFDNVVTVVSGSLKPYFYFVCRLSTTADGLRKRVKARCVVGNGEHIRKHFAFRAENEAAMLIFRNIDTHTDHDDTSGMFI